MKHNNILRFGLALWTVISSANLYAEAPNGYYSTCEGKSGASLLTGLHNKISSHTTISYDGLWDVYKTSDVRDDGTVWDMYSTKHWKVGAEHCGNYSVVGDCINREHSMPKSWFNDAKPMYSDAFHLYPTDGKVNGQRSNFPFGECANGTTLPSNGKVDALGRLGNSTFPGYSGKVFEPDDEYKGDFARSYFYMAACYNDKIAGWRQYKSDVFSGNSWPAYNSWVIDLLLKWHRQDPVSQKELDRQEAVYAHQKNRNPFIDHPELAEHIWGDKTNIGWSENGVAEPVITYPVANAVFDLGATSVGRTSSTTINVKGASLEQDVSVSVSGAGFSVATSLLSSSEVCGKNGAPLTISYLSQTVATSIATITLTSGSASVSFTVKAKAMDGIPIGDPTNISDRSFTANWINIDGAKAKYNFTLWQNDVVVDGYPVEVDASEQRYNVEYLMPETTYLYQLSNGVVTSDKVSVTTGAAIPSIQFLYDGDLFFTAEPGKPGDVAEVLLDVENIDGEITISVNAPFEVSTDKNAWDTTVILDAEEDRFYLRVFSEEEGDFFTELRASCGEYENDVTVEAKVGEAVSFMEDFEQEWSLSGYTGGEYQGSAAKWDIANAGIFAGDKYQSSLQSLRFGKPGSASKVEMMEDREHGIGNVTFWVRKWDKDSASDLAVEFSTDGGITWKVAGHCIVAEEGLWQEASVPVKVAGNVRMRISREAKGGRLNIDDIKMTDYSGVNSVNETLDYHLWDAFCRDGKLIVESKDDNGAFCVYGMDGLLHFNSEVHGVETIELPAGLYVIFHKDFSRRVMVK